MSTPPPFFDLNPLRRAHLIGLALCLSACSQTNGCSGDPNYSFPDKDKVQSALQVRVTEPGFAFLGDQVTPLLEGALPEQLSTCLPGASGEAIGIRWRYCDQEVCNSGEPGCNVSVEIGGVELKAIEPNVVRARVTLQDLDLRFDVGAAPIVDCDISISAPGFPVDLDVGLNTPAPSRNLSAQVMGTDYSLSNLTIRLQGNDGAVSALCDGLDVVLNLPGLRDLIFGLLEGLIDNVLIVALQGAVNSFICLPCEGEADNACLSEGGSCVLGSCIKPDLSCVPRPLGVEGQQDLGALLSSVAPGLSATLGYFVNPGSYAVVEEEGLSLGVITGVNTDGHRCVPPAEQPPISEPPRLTLLNGNLTPEGAEYDLGLAISQTIIDHAMWALHQSGAACLSLTTEAVSQLNSRTFQLLLPKLGQLTRGDAPLAISLSPQLPPAALIGANRLGPPNASGVRRLEEPLITLDWPELWIDFHAFMDARWTRLFSLKVHLVLPIGVSFEPDGGVVPLLGDLNAALTDIEVLNDELLLDDASRIATLLPTLIGPLLNTALSSAAGGFELPSVMGLSLAPQEGSLRGVTEGDEGFITLFADLVAAEAMGAGSGGGMGNKSEEAVSAVSAERGARAAARAARAMARGVALERWVGREGGFTQAAVVSVYDPATEAFLSAEGLALGAEAQPSVTLDLSVAEGSLGGAPEFSWRVDGGPWRPYTPAARLVVRDPALLIPGDHAIEVRARDAADPLTLDPTPARVEVRLEAREQALIGRADPAAAGAAASSGCACDQRSGAARAAALSPLWLMAAALLWALRLPLRRLRGAQTQARGGARLTLVALVGLLGLLAACDDTSRRPRKDPTPPTTCDEGSCGANQRCVEGECRVVSCAEDAALCGALTCEGGAAVCNAGGVCECPNAPLCPDGCGAGEFCCFGTNACAPTPAPCTQGEYAACPPGFELAAVTPGALSQDACALVGEECGCVESSPLPEGLIGRFSDLAVSGEVAWVSAYAETYGDLVVGRGAPGEAFEWAWVDGLPAGAPVVASPSGPRGGVDGAGDDVGQHTSVAVSAGGVVHVAYFDATHQRLKYAVLESPTPGAPWRTYTLDTNTPAGWWADLALTPEGIPAIVYRAEPAEGQTEVRYLRARAAVPTAADWPPALTLHALSYDPATAGLAYPEGTGLFCSLTIAADGKAAAAWYDRTGGNLWVARGDGLTFNAPEVLAGWAHGSRRGDMGASVEAAFDAAGNLHLCYQDGTLDALRYLAPELGYDELVDDGLRLDTNGRARALHVVGDDCGVHFDARGRALILYQDATAHELLLARRDASGSWLRATLRSPNDAGAEAARASGFYARGARVGEGMWVSHYLYNNQVEPLAQGLELFSTTTP